MTKINPHAPYKSWEEVAFSKWCEDLQDLGVILSWEYEPRTFTLSEPIQRTKLGVRSGKEQIVQHYLANCEYTPDFRVQWADGFYEKIYGNPFSTANKKIPFLSVLEFNEILGIQLYTSYFEIKGDQNTVGKDTHVRRAWLFQKGGIFTHLAKITKDEDSSFFAQTFIPQSLLLSERYVMSAQPKYKGVKTPKFKGDSKFLFYHRTANEWLQSL